MNARSSRGYDATAGAKLMVLAMGVAWGLNWVAARIILEVLPPWSMRTAGIGLGAITLFAAAAVRGVPLRIARGDRMKVLIAGFFNVALFGVCSAYAQIYGTTARAVVIAYSMPIWASLLAWLLLGERFDIVRAVALALCAGGLTMLIWPLAQSGFPLGALFALGCAWSWAAGTIYLKRVTIAAPTLAAAAWQLLFGTAMLMAGMLIFEGLPSLGPLPAQAAWWLAYNGLIGMGLAYFLWFSIVDRLPAMTAALGSLLVPVVGVIGSALVVGERPNLTDGIGFALIFTAAAGVLLQRSEKTAEMPE